MKAALAILLVLSFFSCSGTKKKEIAKNFTNPKTLYEFRDISGEYKLKREIIIKENNKFLTKVQLISKDEKGTILEETTAISEFGYIKSNKAKTSILRPIISQHNVWLDGKNYFAQMKVNKENRSLDVVMKSPEEKWNGKKSFTFPTGNAVVCFFSQVVECVKATNYFSQAVKSSAQIRIQVIIDGYPFIGDQYSNMPEGVFSAATLSYDGVNEAKLHSFSMEMGAQSIVYNLDEEYRLVKMFWVAQGLSMVVSGI